MYDAAVQIAAETRCPAEYSLDSPTLRGGWLHPLRRRTPSDAFCIRLFGTTSEFASEAYLADGGIAAKNVPLAGNPLFSTWTRVAIDYDLRAAPHLSVTLDDVLAGDTALDPSLFTPAVADVETGVGYSGHPSSVGSQLRYDDVTVDFDPRERGRSSSASRARLMHDPDRVTRPDPEHVT